MWPPGLILFHTYHSWLASPLCIGSPAPAVCEELASYSEALKLNQSGSVSQETNPGLAAVPTGACCPQGVFATANSERWWDEQKEWDKKRQKGKWRWSFHHLHSTLAPSLSLSLHLHHPFQCYGNISPPPSSPSSWGLSNGNNAQRKSITAVQ